MNFFWQFFESSFVGTINSVIWKKIESIPPVFCNGIGIPGRDRAGSGLTVSLRLGPGRDREWSWKFGLDRNGIRIWSGFRVFLHNVQFVRGRKLLCENFTVKNFTVKYNKFFFWKAELFIEKILSEFFLVAMI